jgi:ribosomal protein L29
MVAIEDFKKLSENELKDELAKRQKDLVLLRFKLTANQLKDTTAISKTRKEIAQINTLMNKNK